MASISSPAQLPLLYRASLLWLEPFGALLGAFMAHLMPENYIDLVSSYTTYDATYQVFLDQIAGTYVYIALTEVLVLRATNDIKVWKAVLLSLLVCDAIHVYSTILSMGIPTFLNPTLWRPKDGMYVFVLIGMIFVRLAFLFEVGFPKSAKSKTR